MADPSRLATAAQVMICVELLAQFGFVMVDDSTPGAFAQAMPVMTLLMGGTMVLVICWLRRCRLHAEVFAPGTHRYSPGLAIGGWFIPVAMLWIPRRVTLDVRRASGLASRAWLVEGWWWARLVKIPVALACARSIPNPMLSPYVALFSAITGIMLLLVIREITAAQVTRITSWPTAAAPTAGV